MFQRLKHLAALATLVLAVTACGGGDDDEVTRNIVQQAQADARLSILVEAVTAADLGATLSGPGPFTVMAPTNDAFASLLQELGVTKDQLLANKPLLTAVLTYHVVPGRVTQVQIPFGTPITTVQGETFTVNSSYVITDQRARTARIVQADIPATNGVVHAIDRVILPRP
jgi:uncharacterized surface protein with fasciclin (FAS1) repeats